QLGHPHRIGTHARARIQRPGGAVGSTRLRRGRKGFPAAPYPRLHRHLNAHQTPNNGGSASTMISPQKKWVRIGASTPPLARRSNAQTVPRMIAAKPSIGLPLAIVAPTYKMVEMATGKCLPSAV